MDLTFAGALVLLVAVGSDHSLTSADHLWLASVEHTITKEERKQYAALADADERRKFQDDFWRSRDPNPVTPQNEALEDYVVRLRFVQEYFQENEVSGVFIERGRMYMRFGPPAYRKGAEMPAQAGGSMSGSRRAWASGRVPVEIWVYDKVPASKPGKYRVVTFVDENNTNRYGILNDELKPLQRNRH